MLFTVSALFFLLFWEFTSETAPKEIVNHGTVYLPVDQSDQFKTLILVLRLAYVIIWLLQNIICSRQASTCYFLSVLFTLNWISLLTLSIGSPQRPMGTGRKRKNCLPPQKNNIPNVTFILYFSTTLQNFNHLIIFLGSLKLLAWTTPRCFRFVCSFLEI